MFLVCGEALWDLFAVEDETGLSFDARIGGSLFNVAVGLARIEQRSALLTGLSTDRLGERLLDALENAGVETGFLVRTPRPTTLSLVDLGADGVPVYAFYGEDAADRSVTLDDLPDLGPEVWGVHAGSYSLVVDPVGASFLALIEREAGRRLITIDPNVRLTVEPEVARWRARVDAFVAVADLVKASDEDLGLLYPGAETSEIAQRWLEAGAAAVVVTRGPNGAEAFGPFGHIAAPGLSVSVIDTVGAGDAFQAALIAGLAELGAKDRDQLCALDAETTTRLLKFAIQASAITCGRRGANLPNRAELAAHLENLV